MYLHRTGGAGRRAREARVQLVVKREECFVGRELQSARAEI